MRRNPKSGRSYAMKEGGIAKCGISEQVSRKRKIGM